MTIIGGALLAAAGLWAGLYTAGTMREQARQARRLFRMTELMRFELERFLTPLPELFESLAERTEGAASDLCGRTASALRADGARFREAWAYACGVLRPAEREILLPLGEILGRYGAAEQTSALDAVEAELRLYSDGLQASLRDKCRICVGLLTAAGLLSAVLLW